jgi:hypothetical protein
MQRTIGEKISSMIDSSLVLEQTRYVASAGSHEKDSATKVEQGHR